MEHVSALGVSLDCSGPATDALNEFLGPSESISFPDVGATLASDKSSPMFGSSLTKLRERLDSISFRDTKAKQISETSALRFASSSSGSLKRCRDFSFTFALLDCLEGEDIPAKETPMGCKTLHPPSDLPPLLKKKRRTGLQRTNGCLELQALTIPREDFPIPFSLLCNDLNSQLSSCCLIPSEQNSNSKL